MYEIHPPSDLQEVTVALLTELRAREFQLSGSVGSCIVHPTQAQVQRTATGVVLHLPAVSGEVARVLGVRPGVAVVVRLAPYRHIDQSAWG